MAEEKKTSQIKKDFWRMSLIQMTLFAILVSLMALIVIGIILVNQAKPGEIVATLMKLDLWNDGVKYGPFIVASLVSGFIGAKARIYMDEMKIAKNPVFATLSKDLKDMLLVEFGFSRHNYFLGIVASFVAIITLGQELSIMHQLVIGILSSMAGSQFLSQRLDDGGAESPNFSILASKLEHLHKISKQASPPLQISHAEVAVTVEEC